MSKRVVAARPRARTRSPRGPLAAALSLLLAATALALTPAPAAQAAGSARFDCQVVYGLGTSDTHVIRRIDPVTGASTTNGDLDQGNGDDVNALALPAGGGQHAWAFNRNDNTVLRHDADTGTTRTWSAPTSTLAARVVAGAINPVNGVFYYAASSDGVWTVFAFNTITSTALGKVATITSSGLRGNGDLAFDGLGNLYVVSNDNDVATGVLVRVTGTLPTAATSSPAALGASLLTGTPGQSGRYTSIAIDKDGYLVIGTSAGKLIRVDAASGATISNVNGPALADLASCALPSTGSVRVDLPQGRHGDGDQFSVAITGGGVTAGNTGTTAGTDSGLQDEPDEVGGAVLTKRGTVYTVTQTAAGTTSLGSYETTWRCVRQSDGAVLGQGSGQTGSYTAPSAAADVVCTFTNTPRKPSVDLVKTAGAVADANRNGQQDAGDTIAYTFKVTNTGNLTLSAVKVTDPKVGAVTCTTTTLVAGASTTCSAPAHVLTQADVDHGKVVNTATAEGTSPQGVRVTDSDSTTTPVVAQPGIVLDKTAGAVVDTNGNGTQDAGDTITYAFTVTNTGNVTLTGVEVTDPKVGTVTCPTSTLAPGARAACTAAPYVLERADVDAGRVVNRATAEGTSPTGVEVADDDSATTNLTAAADVELDKSAGPVVDANGNGRQDAGDTIAYAFTVTNTGAVTLTDVTVSDPRVGAVTCAGGPLAAGAERTCTAAPYVLTQADLDAGRVVNTATATGKGPDGTPVTHDDGTTTTLTAAPAIALVKTAGGVVDTNGSRTQDAGDTITYTFKVTNTGTVTLRSVSVSDPMVGAVSCPAGDLAPGAGRTCTAAAHVLTQADVDAGKVVNTATATGTPAQGGPVTGTDSTTTPLAGKPGITLVKTAGPVVDANGNGSQDAGDTISYRFVVTNTGSVTLTSVTLTDPKVGAVGCPSDPLAPGAERRCGPVVYTLTAGDVDAGNVVNTAKAVGTTPGGDTVTADDSTTTVLVPPAASTANITVAKRVSDTAPRAGDVVTYTLVVRNTGAATATDVVLTDPLPAGVVLVSAGAGCSSAGGTVSCDLGDVEAGGARTVTVKAEVRPLPTGAAAQQHDLDVQKVEAHLDLDPGQTRTLAVSCQPGYVVTDGSGRVDAVDQGTGTLASVHVLESRATDAGSWTVTAVNDATGRAQAKVFAVCVQGTTATAGGHRHDLVVSEPVTRTVDLTGGRDEVTLQCAPGRLPVTPGFALDGAAGLPTSYPAGESGWTFAVAGGAATRATFAIRCLDRELGEAAGHRHALALGEVQRTVTVPAGATVEEQLTCADGSKGVVAGWDLDAGLVNLGNDPRPITRASRLTNPTDRPLAALLWLRCLGVRTEGGDPSGLVVNTASASTATAETSYDDNAGTASLTVDTSSVATPAAATVRLAGVRPTAQVACTSGTTACRGTAVLAAATTQQVGGTKVTRGAVLARTTYTVAAGKRATVRLTPTALGRRALKARALRKARLTVGGTTRVVTVRR